MGIALRLPWVQGMTMRGKIIIAVVLATALSMWAAIIGFALALAGHGTDVFVVGAAGTMLGLFWLGNR
jgi:hypothetical protein